MWSRRSGDISGWKCYDSAVFELEARTPGTCERENRASEGMPHALKPSDYAARTDYRPVTRPDWKPGPARGRKMTG